MKVVVCGSISIRTLTPQFVRRLGNIVELGATVLVGDAPGGDTAAQAELHSRGYRNVLVYHRGHAPRNNLGGWPTVQVAGSYTDRDRKMCADADYGLALWNGTSPGTRRNIHQLGRRMAVVRT
jgi:hypothetical protein